MGQIEHWQAQSEASKQVFYSTGRRTFHLPIIINLTPDSGTFYLAT